MKTGVTFAAAALAFVLCLHFFRYSYEVGDTWVYRFDRLTGKVSIAAAGSEEWTPIGQPPPRNAWGDVPVKP